MSNVTPIQPGPPMPDVPPDVEFHVRLPETGKVETLVASLAQVDQHGSLILSKSSVKPNLDPATQEETPYIGERTLVAIFAKCEWATVHRGEVPS